MDDRGRILQIDGRQVKVMGVGKQVSDVVIYKDVESGELWTRDIDSLPTDIVSQIEQVVSDKQKSKESQSDSVTQHPTDQTERVTPTGIVNEDKTTNRQYEVPVTELQGVSDEDERYEEPKDKTGVKPESDKILGFIDPELMPQNMLKFNNKHYLTLVYMSVIIFVLYSIARIVMGDVATITRPVAALYGGIFLQVFSAKDKRWTVWVYQILALMGSVLYLFKIDTVYYTYYWWWVLSLYFSWTLIGIVGDKYKAQLTETIKWMINVVIRGTVYAIGLGFVINIIPAIGDLFFWQMNNLVDTSIYSNSIENFIFLVVVPFAFIKVIDLHEDELTTIEKVEDESQSDVTNTTSNKYSWVVILNYVYYMMLFLFIVFILPSYFMGLEDKTLILLQLTRDLTLFLSYSVGIGLIRTDYNTTFDHKALLHKITLGLTGLTFINQILATIITFPQSRVMYWVAWYLIATVLLTEFARYTKKGESLKKVHQLAYMRVGVFCLLVLMPFINPWNLSYQYTVQGLENRTLEFVDNQTFTNHWALGFDDRRRDELNLPDDAEQYYLDPYFSDDEQKNEWVGEYYYGEDGYYN